MGHRKKAKALGLFVGIAVSVVILGVLFSNIDWNAFVSELKRFNIFFLPALGLVYWASLLLRAYRWRYLIPDGDRLEFRGLYKATVIGLLANFVLPLRAGEFVRPWMLARILPVTFSRGLASVVTERVFDVLSLLLLLGITVPQLDRLPDEVLLGAKALGVLSVFVIAVVLLAYWKGELLVRFADYLIRVLITPFSSSLGAKLSSMVVEIVHGLQAVRTVRDLLVVFFCSMLLWGCYAFFFQIGLWAFGVHPGALAGVVVAVVTGVVIAAPSGPGFVGTYQLGCIIALSYIYGLSEEFALGYSVVVHVFQVLLTLALGMHVLRGEGLGLLELRRRAEAETCA